MNESEFSWHPILPHPRTDAGMHLGCPGEPWMAIFNLHHDTTTVRSVTCESEMEAIQAVECWLDGLLAS